jgi:hypothetical protein
MTRVKNAIATILIQEGKNKTVTFRNLNAEPLSSVKDAKDVLTTASIKDLDEKLQKGLARMKFQDPAIIAFVEGKTAKPTVVQTRPSRISQSKY